jgi:NADH-quinone oxidoreductase subunit A
MQNAFLPIFLFVVCTIGLAIAMLIVARIFNPGRPNRVTRMPYESGMNPIHDTHRRFDVRFHLLAIAFLVFDVELLFLYPWAVIARPESQHAATSNLPPPALQAKTVNHTVLLPSDRRGGGSEGGLNNDNQNQPQHALTLTISPREMEPNTSPQSPVPDPSSRHILFGGVMTFLFLLTLGFIYDWRKGIFEWR